MSLFRDVIRGDVNDPHRSHGSSRQMIRDTEVTDRLDIDWQIIKCMCTKIMEDERNFTLEVFNQSPLLEYIARYLKPQDRLSIYLLTKRTFRHFKTLPDKKFRVYVSIMSSSDRTKYGNRFIFEFRHKYAQIRVLGRTITCLINRLIAMTEDEKKGYEEFSEWDPDGDHNSHHTKGTYVFHDYYAESDEWEDCRKIFVGCYALTKDEREHLVGPMYNLENSDKIDQENIDNFDLQIMPKICKMAFQITCLKLKIIIKQKNC